MRAKAMAASRPINGSTCPSFQKPDTAPVKKLVAGAHGLTDLKLGTGTSEDVPHAPTIRKPRRRARRAPSISGAVNPHRQYSGDPLDVVDFQPFVKVRVKIRTGTKREQRVYWERVNGLGLGG
jgi:hypothetical protein